MNLAMAVVIVQIAMLLALPPFIIGLIRKVKARLQCRRGASVLQPYADLAKLFKKQPVVSSTTSWIFTATPYIVFSSTLAAGLLVPIFVSQNPFNFAGNVIALVYLLALGTFFLILAGFPPVIKLLENWASPWLVDVVTSFSVMRHFEGFQRGVLDSRDVIFFLSVIVFSLFTTSAILRGHRAG